MAKNRITFEKHQRDAKKKRKAEEKRALKQKKKEAKTNGDTPTRTDEEEAGEDAHVS